MPRKGLDRKIPLFRKGQTAFSGRHLNSIVEGVNRALTGINAPVQPKPRGKGGSPVLVLTLVTHNNDYLECEDADANTVYVAKVYELRRTPFDGETIGGVTYTYASASEREASGGFDTETQFITPAYVVGAEIFALRVMGETGVATATQYIEMNQGRAWAYDPDA